MCWGYSDEQNRYNTSPHKACDNYQGMTEVNICLFIEKSVTKKSPEWLEEGSLRRPRGHAELKVTILCLECFLPAMGKHWRALRQDKTWSPFCFTNSALTTAWNMGENTVWAEIRKLLGKLLHRREVMAACIRCRVWGGRLVDWSHIFEVEMIVPERSAVGWRREVRVKDDFQASGMGRRMEKWHLWRWGKQHWGSRIYLVVGNWLDLKDIDSGMVNLVD